MAGKSPKPGKGKAGNTPPAADASSEIKAFSPHLWMRNRYLQAHKTVIYGQGRFFRYKDGVFLEVPGLRIRKEIALLAEDDKHFQVTSAAIASVSDLVRDYRAVPDEQFDNNPDVLLFNDCVLDLNTFQRLPHSPKYYATSKLPFNYDPAAKSDAWAKWGERIDAEVRMFTEEFGGLCLTTDTRFEKSVWLVGPPNCGKGTFIEAVQAALGPQRWVTLSPADISNRFGLVNLAGKTLAIASEAPPVKNAYCTTVINRIISGEAVRVEQKGQPGYDLTPRCKLLCAMNHLPYIHDADNGIFRRTDIVKLPPLDVEIQPQIKQEIIANGQAMVNVFLTGLRRLRERGHFDVPLSVRIASQEFHKDNDHVALFLEDRYQKAVEHREQTAEVHGAYFSWCSANGYRYTLTTRKLKDELERLGFRYRRSDGSWYEGFKPL
jgi:putative DNA primase/helicase